MINYSPEGIGRLDAVIDGPLAESNSHVSED